MTDLPGLVGSFVLLGGSGTGPATLLSESGGKVAMRGIYGGIPKDVLDGPATLADYGVNAIFLGSGSVDPEKVALVHAQGGRIYAEFNTLHMARLLETFPDAAPVGPDGKVSPPPSGWQGICPSHQGYRNQRMQEFTRLLREYALDGIWLDYHHGHASWEQSIPELPETCFCPACLVKFEKDTRIALPKSDVPGASRLLLGELNEKWIAWRCDLFADWLREFRSILDRERPQALLGTFHAPWNDWEFDRARTRILAIDLKKQAPFLDVFSPMPYHARFGHVHDLKWIANRISWLGATLDLRGTDGEKRRIWPIVQLSDWGEKVQAADVFRVLEHGVAAPATGVMVFAWGSLEGSPDKVREMKRFFLTQAATTGSPAD